VKIYLKVRDTGTTDVNTLYVHYVPDINTWLPDGAIVSVPFGQGDSSGITEPVARCYFNIAKSDIHVELNEVWLDPPDSWGSYRTISPWRCDGFDGETRTPEEFSRHVHEGLLLGGWKKYGG